MSDQITETTDDQSEGSRLRKELEAAKAELRAFKAEKRHAVYKTAGLPEGAFDLFDEKYDGELTPESVREFGQAKGFAFLDVKSEQDVPSTPGSDGLDQLAAGAIPQADPSITDQIKKAEADGDWATVDLLNAKLLNAARNS